MDSPQATTLTGQWGPHLVVKEDAAEEGTEKAVNHFVGEALGL